MWFLKSKKGASDDTSLQDAAALLWDESRRQITRQESDLDTLRNRAVALLSVSSIVAGLFGGRLVTVHHHPGYVTAAIVVALAFFALSVLAVIVVLSPKRKGWEFAQNLDQWFALLRAGDLAPVDVTANLARHVEASRKRNQVVLERLYLWFGIACLLTGLEVVAWGVSIL